MSEIDLNADLGEGMDYDAELLDIVTSASVACGGHAGDAATMEATLRAAKSRGVVTGAHPGFADRENFGRVRLILEFPALWDQISGQIADVVTIAEQVGQPISYVKLHGALYNMAAEDQALSEQLFATIKDTFGPLPIMTLDGSAQVRAAERIGLPIIREGFADRAYLDDGTLAPRDRPGAVLHDPDAATAQAVRMARAGEIATLSGKVIPCNVQSICLHGDNAAALELARAVRAGLEAEGIAVRAVV